MIYDLDDKNDLGRQIGRPIFLILRNMAFYAVL